MRSTSLLQGEMMNDDAKVQVVKIQGPLRRWVGAHAVSEVDNPNSNPTCITSSIVYMHIDTLLPWKSIRRIARLEGNWEEILFDKHVTGETLDCQRSFLPSSLITRSTEFDRRSNMTSTTTEDLGEGNAPRYNIWWWILVVLTTILSTTLWDRCCLDSNCSDPRRSEFYSPKSLLQNGKLREHEGCRKPDS